MTDSGIFLPMSGLASLSTPPGDLSLFASGWRLSWPEGVERTVSFQLTTGATLRATIAAATSASLWARRDGVWMTGASALELLPPLAPEPVGGGGLPLPLGSEGASAASTVGRRR